MDKKDEANLSQLRRIVDKSHQISSWFTSFNQLHGPLTPLYPLELSLSFIDFKVDFIVNFKVDFLVNSEVVGIGFEVNFSAELNPSCVDLKVNFWVNSEPTYIDFEVNFLIDLSRSFIDFTVDFFGGFQVSVLANLEADFEIDSKVDFSTDLKLDWVVNMGFLRIPTWK